MSKNLVIVESPAKAKTIEQYLGKDFTVAASMGHVRDLPKSKMGIDTEKDFEPSYTVPQDKKKTIKCQLISPVLLSIIEAGGLFEFARTTQW